MKIVTSMIHKGTLYIQMCHKYVNKYIYIYMNQDK